jgi:CDP-diglyceride synthetase
VTPDVVWTLATAIWTILPAYVPNSVAVLVGALGASLALAPSWSAATSTPPVVLTAVVVTPLFHLGTNGAAHLLGLKDEPW